MPITRISWKAREHEQRMRERHPTRAPIAGINEQTGSSVAMALLAKGYGAG